jgi:Na+/H+-dicarboxylate symporter
MKLWMRILAGSVVGLVLGIYFPIGADGATPFLQMIASVMVTVGRYAIFPLAFFGVVIGIHELRQDKMTTKVYGKAALMVLATTGIAVVLGTLVTLFLSPRRIPPIFQEAMIESLPSLPVFVTGVFPANFFTIFTSNAGFLLPVVAGGVLIGLVLYHEGPSVDPAVDVMEALARTFYRVNAWLNEIVSFALIAIAAYWVVQLRVVTDLALFAPLIWVVIGIAVLLAVIGYPLVLFLWADRYNPFTWLYGLVPPVLAAFFSGDSYFAFGPLTRVAKENYGISREAAAPVLTLTTLFAKAGSAMVIAASFVTVFRSYTALEITFGQVLWIMLAAFAISFVLGRAPGMTVIVGLSVLAGWYGEGMQDIYLILLPALPILTGIAVAVDTMTAAAITFLTATLDRKRRIVDALDFV